MGDIIPAGKYTFYYKSTSYHREVAFFNTMVLGVTLCGEDMKLKR